jgi:hypothetical protein
MRAKTTLLGLALVLLLGALQAGGAAAVTRDAASTRLYSQDAERGTLVPARRPGEYMLTLRGVKPKALWFDNLPGKRQGGISNGRLVHMLFGRGRAPENAAVDAWDPRRRDDVIMGVELLSGNWNRARRVLRYRVRDLGAASPERSPFVGAKLPRRFSEAGVFINGVASTEIGKVFVQDAAGGSFRPAGRRGLYRLTLRGAKAHALWFQDHPGVLAGAVPQRKVLDPFFKGPGGEPPNAAIDAWDPTRRDDVTVGFKLIDGEWDAEHHALRYLVRPLRTGRGIPGGATLPRHFSQAGLFVDNCTGACAEAIAKNLNAAYNYFQEFFGNRQTCAGVITNRSGQKLTWRNQNKTGSWDREPDRVIPFDGALYPTSSVFASVGDWRADCYAYAEYEIGSPSPDGGRRILGIGIFDPLYGPNEFGCGATAPYGCWLEPSNVAGDHIILRYCILGPATNIETCPNYPVPEKPDG